MENCFNSLQLKTKIPNGFNYLCKCMYKQLISKYSKGNYSKIFILADTNTAKYCLPLLPDTLKKNSTIIKIKPGEKNKTIETVQLICQTLIKSGADRKSILLNLGGGMVSDIGGFCASIYMRGIDFINIPTSLMGMIDAAHGGKTGIDFNLTKNTLGTFNPPQEVIIDYRFLKTLPVREFTAATSEMIKHSLIADKKYFRELLVHKSTSEYANKRHISKSISIKKRIVRLDPYEKNIRAYLNFGHTIGHALESTSLNTPNPILHGEAIAAGLVCECYISHILAGFPAKSLGQICGWYLRNFKKPKLSSSQKVDLMHYLNKDKKNHQNQIRMVLLAKPGKPYGLISVSKGSIDESLLFLENLK